MSADNTAPVPLLRVTRDELERLVAWHQAQEQQAAQRKDYSAAKRHQDRAEALAKHTKDDEPRDLRGALADLREAASNHIETWERGEADSIDALQNAVHVAECALIANAR